MTTISPTRAERIARNINAMDIEYHYIDGSGWKFWNGLRTKLVNILRTLSDADKGVIKALCNKEKAEYFGLV